MLSIQAQRGRAAGRRGALALIAIRWWKECGSVRVMHSFRGDVEPSCLTGFCPDQLCRESSSEPQGRYSGCFDRYARRG